jgi:L-threonylcarbamoyladenylate synthase
VLSLTAEKGEVPNGVMVPMPLQPAPYARCLYATLRELDQQGFDWILVEEPSPQEEWLAVRDRLARADAKMRSEK